MKFTSEKFSSFISVCNFIGNICSDLQIKNKKIYQQSDNRVFVVKSDLSDLFEEEDIEELRITPIDSKMQILSTFIENDVPVTLEKDDKYYSFSDNISKLYLRIPSEDILVNKYDDNLVVDFSKDNFLCDMKLNSSMLKKLKKTVNITASNSTEMYFDPKTSTVSANIVSSSKNIKLNLFEQEYNKNVIDKEFIINTSNECFLNVPAGEEITLEFYYDPEKEIIIQKTNIAINDIPIEIYQRNRIKNVDQFSESNN